MPQGMDTRALLNARPLSRLIIALLGGATGHGLLGFGAGNKPGPWALDLPIGAKFVKQTLREQAVAVFVAFTLVDTDQHPARIALDIGDPEPDHFADAQASRIHGHE